MMQINAHHLQNVFYLQLSVILIILRKSTMERKKKSVYYQYDNTAPN